MVDPIPMVDPMSTIPLVPSPLGVAFDAGPQSYFPLFISKYHADLVRRRQRQNAVTAIGHFLSWSTEFLVGIIFGIIIFAFDDVDANIVELVVFSYPAINIVLFPLVQMLSSSVLKAEAAELFKEFVEKVRNSCQVNCKQQNDRQVEVA